jgi:hypothetical protein
MTTLSDSNPSLPGLVFNNPVKYAQYLQKQTTGTVKLWKARYFVLANNMLWYFKDKGTAVVGSEVFKIDLQRCSVRKLSERGSHYVEFVYTTAMSIVETLLLKAATANDAEKWLSKVQESKAAAIAPKNLSQNDPVHVSAPQLPPPAAAQPAQPAASSQQYAPPVAPSPALTERSFAPSNASMTPWDRFAATISEVFPPNYPVSYSARSKRCMTDAAAAAAAFINHAHILTQSLHNLLALHHLLALQERSGIGMTLTRRDGGDAGFYIGDLKPQGSLARLAAVS